MTKRTMTPDDGYAVCVHCDTPYRWDKNLLGGEHLWVRQCRAACRREHPSGSLGANDVRFVELGQAG